jgi:hypothetical protein
MNDTAIWVLLKRLGFTTLLMLQIAILFLTWGIVTGLNQPTVTGEVCTLNTLKIGDAVEIRGKYYVLSKIGVFGRSGALIELSVQE